VFTHLHKASNECGPIYDWFYADGSRMIELPSAVAGGFFLILVMAKSTLKTVHTSAEIKILT